MREKRGASELTSTVIIISISIATALAAAVYTNSLAGERMKEHGEEVSNIINKNNEDIVIVHVDYNPNNSICNDPLVVWVYNAGSIDTNVVKATIDSINLTLPASTLLPKHTITILCFNYSSSGTLVLECTYGNKDEYEVNI
ncbi:MAG: hypothetical protein KatS3mg003_0363 [Candidatus Nitrosocaldaceae archaeon]|nr:MAG: hypothetical protein KatS3mg003_0363 [Candidatus Nitrosocaldaceae archaeon]